MVKRSAETPTIFAIGYKVFFGFLGFTAIATEVATLVERGMFNPVNFFSYFTILTNLLVVLTFIVSAVALAHGKNKSLSAIRSAVTVYILIVGIGFALLLSGLDGVTFSAVPWDNAVLHYIIPVAVLLDFIFDRPYRTRFTKALWWLAYPFAYLVYTLLRGAVTGWYPYPFLNPVTHGILQVIVTVIGIILLAVGLTWLAVRFGKPRRQK